MSRISEQQLASALALADDGQGEPFELVPATETSRAQVVDLHPVSPGEYLVYCIRRVKGERARYLKTTKAGIAEGMAEAEAKRQAEEGTVREPTAKEIEAARKKAVEAAAAEMLEHVDTQIDSGPESMAALVACSMGHPGNETIERRLIRSPKLLALHEVASRLTFSQPGFHDAVSAFVWGARAATEEATGSSASEQS